jgi:hypothetical protein
MSILVCFVAYGIVLVLEKHLGLGGAKTADFV